MFDKVCKEIKQRYLGEQVSETEIAIRCFDLMDVDLLVVYDIERPAGDGIFSPLKKGNRPAVAATNAGLSYTGQVLMKLK